jgi:DNA-binding PadR family transcriptional regulator
VEHVVLGLLIIQRLTIYELNRAFKLGISMFYSASYGSLQIAVKNLLSKGMIVFKESVDKGRNKKVYSITDTGKEAFYRWMLDDIPINKLEVTALSKIYFLGLIPSVEERKFILQNILSKIESVQADLNTMNEELNRLEIPASYMGVFKYQLKTLDYGQRAHSFAREWFHSLLIELENCE